MTTKNIKTLILKKREKEREREKHVFLKYTKRKVWTNWKMFMDLVNNLII